jgi:hypothetical protein
MADVHIRKGYRGIHVISPETEVGRKWLIENLMSVVTQNGSISIPISSEFAEEIAIAIREDGIDVDLE